MTSNASVTQPQIFKLPAPKLVKPSSSFSAIILACECLERSVRSRAGPPLEQVPLYAAWQPLSMQLPRLQTTMHLQALWPRRSCWLVASEYVPSCDLLYASSLSYVCAYLRMHR